MNHLLKALNPCKLSYKSKYHIIASLFRKRNQKEIPKPPPLPKDADEYQNNKQQEKEKQLQDEVYDFFQRRRQIDTSFDFSKLKGISQEMIPQDIGKGGIEEVLYWSQSAKTPEQINHTVRAFNKTAISHSHQVKGIINNRVHLEEFNNRLIGNVYLVASLQMLRQYSLFAYTFKLNSPEFWEKMEFKVIKYFPTSIEEIGELIDIGFMMGQFEAGVVIYNHICQILQQKVLTIDQYIKLYLTYHMLKRGQKSWIDKLIKGIEQNIHQADSEQISALLVPLKQAKRLPEDMITKLEKRALELIDQFSFKEIMNLSEFFGFDHKNQTTWNILELRTEVLLKEMSIDSNLLSEIINKVMNNYQFSTSFIRTYVIGPIEKSKLSILEQLQPRTLSALSKGLYIYEMEAETKHLQIEISKLVISKVTNQINELSDSDLIKVIQDYNLSRNGVRQLYIFFQEVIRMKFLRGYNPQLDRHTIELLLQIYKNSGMCSRELYEGLQALILQ